MRPEPAQKVHATTRTGQIMESIVENPAKMAKIKKVFYVSLALLVVVDVFIHRHHPVFAWDVIPGFSAAYGFISTVLIVVISKFIGHAFLMKPENYYHD